MALANVTLTNTFDDWRTRTNQILVQGEQTFVVANGAFNKVNVVNVYATSIALSTNSYALATATSIGTSGNNYALAIGTSGNNYALAIGTSGNNYALAIGTSGNNYATAIGTGANANAASASYLTSGTIPVARVSGNYNLITGLGTITSGVWNGTDIALAAGGTNASLTASAGAVAYSTASAIAFTGVGTSGQVLTSSGTSAPTWATIFPSTTAMLFAQATAPTGWTKSTTHNDKALRVVSGTSGGSSGGTVVFSTAFSSKAVSGSISSTTATGTISSVTATGTVGSTVLTVDQIPSHQHFIAGPGGSTAAALSSSNYTDFSVNYSTNNNYILYGNAAGADRGLTSATGGGLGHTHTFTGNAHAHTFTGDAHSHTFTGTAIDMAVQYVDIIIATKD